MPFIVCSFENPRGAKPRISPFDGLSVMSSLAKVYRWQVGSAIGKYRGDFESSVTINGAEMALGPDGQLQPAAAVLADALAGCGQETLLHVDARSRAQLIYLADGSRQHLGLWREVDLAARDTLDAWTQIDHRLFTCG